MKDFKGVFIPKEQTGEPLNAEKLHRESDREKSLSDHRWHKKPPNRKTVDTTQKSAIVMDARDNIKQKPSVIPIIVFSELANSSRKTEPTRKVTSTTSTQTDPQATSATTQTDLSIATGETYE